MSGSYLDISKLLDVVRGRPQMYLPSKSITALSTFVSGAYFAERMINAGKVDYEDELSLFRDKVAAKYSVETSHSWPSILLYHSGSEEKAFELFFQLWDELM